ncbi:hypothetical protein CDV52_09255 [Haematobacter missouriensis]|uniref:Uncharacterized protein n=1 Tax=Haematobacter missouriensis TaxID=366616 RepID=A0A212ARB9_9RHOB|nr:hypothetical protein CDV52_09255 [Haematobacter missouriensis]
MCRFVTQVATFRLSTCLFGGRCAPKRQRIADFGGVSQPVAQLQAQHFRHHSGHILLSHITQPRHAGYVTGAAAFRQQYWPQHSQLRFTTAAFRRCAIRS